MYKLGFIGVGNMGGALLDACTQRISGSGIIAADHDRAKVDHFRQKYGCMGASPAVAASAAQFLFIGVKPQMAEDAFAEIRDSLRAREEMPVIVSMMAGITMERIRELAGVPCPVIRIMPNVAASVGEAMILAASLDVPDAVLADFCGFMQGAGRLDFIPEKLIDAGTAVQGCGPAFVCMFVEALADGAVRCGVPRAKAYEYAIQTIRGTAVLLEESGKHPGEVKDMVTSPAGSTIEGVAALEENGFRHAVIEAVTKAYGKNVKLK
ncbi:MAG: pyrroline-5-carboxylate reductase [Clostridia bacterium]|nr:pyrroline-5-carboxylate reductase [Clostridia bacterium]MBQ8370596.1 pyrroline-5-carboxylate reductase [Clostridia bacterium]